MAAVTLYIDTDVVGGLGDGSSEANAYAGYIAAFDHITGTRYSGTTLVAAGDNVTVICIGGDGTGIKSLDTLTSTRTWASGFADATNFLLFTAQEEMDGVWNTERYTLQNAAGAEAQARSAGIIHEQIQCISTGLDPSSTNRYLFESRNTNTFRRIIAKPSLTNTGTGRLAFLQADAGASDPTVENCIFDDFDSVNGEVVFYESSTSSGLFYNNRLNNCTRGIEKNAGAVVTAKNNVFNNVTTEFTNTTNLTASNNVTTNGSLFGTDNVVSSTNVDADKAGAGLGPGADANVPAVDIAGDTRSGATTDAGAKLAPSSGNGGALASGLSKPLNDSIDKQLT